MGIERKEAETEALGSEIKTKENNLAKRIEGRVGLASIAFFLAGSAMAKEAIEQKIPTEPEKIRTELLKVEEINKTKLAFLEQMELVKEPFATVKLEEGKIGIEPFKAEFKKPKVSEEAGSKIELTEEEIEKKPPLG